jgi:signal transduction histidine kinase
MPLGVLAPSDALALEAIEAGADEALCFTEPDTYQLLLLVDRTTQRAALRRAQENQSKSAAQSEKLAALGTVVAGVAHEINNPLAAVRLSAEFLKSRLGPLFDSASDVLRLAERGSGATAEELASLAALTRHSSRPLEGKRVLDELIGLVDTIAAIVRDLRIYARPDDDETPQIVEVVELIEQVLRIAGSDITSRAHVERDYGEAVPPLFVPRSRLVQVLTNILVNAGHAIRALDRPSHRVRITVRADEEAIAISISDTGPGIPPDDLERIFDPFYTTKRDGMGTGLGLPISRSILRRLGGDLLVESVHGVGATFVAIIPLHDAAPRLSEPPPMAGGHSERPSWLSRLCVLVVEDDERLLRSYPRILRERYEVIAAADGQEAIDLLMSGSQVDVVVSDLGMPEVDGRQLLSWLEEQRPELARRTLFIHGVGDDDYRPFLASVSNLALEKPVSREQLLAAIEQIATQ